MKTSVALAYHFEYAFHINSIASGSVKLPLIPEINSEGQGFLKSLGDDEPPAFAESRQDLMPSRTFSAKGPLEPIYTWCAALKLCYYNLHGGSFQ